MPTSILIPDVFALLKKLQPASVLDIGVGFGKIGFLAREYLDLWHRRYNKADWKVKIDGIEGFEKYLTPVHKYIYDTIHIGNVMDMLDLVSQYEVVTVCDVIEHLSRDDGERLLAAAKRYIVTTPAVFNPQGAAYGNELERHVSQWGPQDFENAIIVHSDIEKVTPIILGWKGIEKP